MRQGGNKMLTYGYLREATQAHIDLDEQETQAMNLQTRYHIFANEAMQAICSVKPKYDYFKVKIVDEYNPIINLGNNNFREATTDELNWESNGMPEPNFADLVYVTQWYESQNIYLMNSQVRMPEDFIAFVNKQAWAFTICNRFDSELFIKGYTSKPIVNSRVPATKSMFMYSGVNTLTFMQEGDFWIPYKGTWFRFKSGISDNEPIDMPIDILLTIPIYVAALCLQIDHIQKAGAKRAEFELALSRVSNTDFLTNKIITPSFK